MHLPPLCFIYSLDHLVDYHTGLSRDYLLCTLFTSCGYNVITFGHAIHNSISLVGCQTTAPSTDPTTTTTTSTGSDTTSTDLVDQNRQGNNNIIYIGKMWLNYCTLGYLVHYSINLQLLLLELWWLWQLLHCYSSFCGSARGPVKV